MELILIGALTTVKLLKTSYYNMKGGVLMARPRKPASLKQGKSESKEHLDERADFEEEIRGDADKLKNIPSSLDDLGAKYYIFIIDELEISGILANLDIPIITQAADSLSKMDQLDEILKTSPMIYSTYDKMGNLIPKEHPAIGAKMKYMTQFRALATQLGLSPSSRAQLAEMNMNKKSDEEDPLLKALGED